jgi:hypothetical protein
MRHRRIPAMGLMNRRCKETLTLCGLCEEASGWVLPKIVVPPLASSFRLREGVISSVFGSQ